MSWLVVQRLSVVNPELSPSSSTPSPSVSGEPVPVVCLQQIWVGYAWTAQSAMCAFVLLETVAIHVALTDAHVAGKFTYLQDTPLKHKLGLAETVVFSSACEQGKTAELILMMALHKGLFGSVAHALLHA